MWAWQQAVVYSGHEQGRFERICKALEKDHIYYEPTIVNLEYRRFFSLELIFGTFGRDVPRYKYWFSITVHKKDRERAEYWVRRTV